MACDFSGLVGLLYMGWRWGSVVVLRMIWSELLRRCSIGLQQEAFSNHVFHVADRNYLKGVLIGFTVLRD